MDGAAETASLFTRGRDSVRLVRRGRPGGPIRLFVLGPGPTSSVYDCLDAIDCVNYQSRIESALVGEGYQLASFSEANRRSGSERRNSGRGHDHRRDLHLVTM